jgi:hypothetical protein
LTDYFLAACHEISGEQLNEFVLDILDEIEFCRPISAHYKDSKEAMGLFNA